MSCQAARRARPASRRDRRLHRAGGYRRMPFGSSPRPLRPCRDRSAFPCRRISSRSARSYPVAAGSPGPNWRGGAQGEVVFARAAFVAVAFDTDLTPDNAPARRPGRPASAGRRGGWRIVVVEIDTVADIDDEVLIRAWDGPVGALGYRRRRGPFGRRRGRRRGRRGLGGCRRRRLGRGAGGQRGDVGGDHRQQPHGITGEFEFHGPISPLPRGRRFISRLVGRPFLDCAT